MIPPQFEYFAPKRWMRRFLYLTSSAPRPLCWPEAKPDPLMKLQLAVPEYVVDINRIPGLPTSAKTTGSFALEASPGRRSWTARKSSGLNIPSSKTQQPSSPTRWSATWLR